jgi:hypothetical protein
MAERDILRYQVTTTGTSIGLGDTSYPTVEADLTQDFGLQRVVRGLDSIRLTVTYSTSGVYVEPDNNRVLIEILDAFNNTILSDTETRSGTGQYYYTYSVPASTPIGIYKAVHSASIAGSGVVTEDFFKVVTSTPGSYYGKVVRGEDTVVATLSNEAQQLIDAGSSVTVTIKSSTGVIVASGLADDALSYSYTPGYNDSEGDFQVIFSFIVNGVTNLEQQFFTVAARREDNLVTTEEFKNSVEMLRFTSKIAKLTNEQIDNMLADAQAMAAQYVGYPIGNKLISGEKLDVRTDSKGFLYLRPRARNITKLIRCILRFHPVVSLTLPVSGFLLDSDTGVLKYVFTGGMILPGSIRGILNEYSFENWYEAIVDYETGFVRDEKIRIKKAVRLLALDILKQGLGLYDVAQIKAGNYQENYFDPLRTRNKGRGMSPLQEQAYEILQYFQRAPIV